MLNSRIIGVAAGSLTALALVSGGVTVLAANGHAGGQAAQAAAVTPIVAPVSSQLSTATMTAGTHADASPSPMATSHPASDPVRHTATTRAMTTTRRMATAPAAPHPSVAPTHHAESDGCADGHQGSGGGR